jgi:hypothetical protein
MHEEGTVKGYRVFSVLGGLEAPGPLLVHLGAGSNAICSSNKDYKTRSHLKCH